MIKIGDIIHGVVSGKFLVKKIRTIDTGEGIPTTIYECQKFCPVKKKFAGRINLTGEMVLEN